MKEFEGDAVALANEYEALKARDLPEAIERQSTLFKGNTFIDQMLDAVPDPYVALNERLQVVFANRALKAFTDRDRSSFYGERLGEIVQCVNAGVGPNGCGTSEACRTCGVTAAVLEALRGQTTVREARLTLEGGQPVDVRVHASPMVGTPEPTVLVAIINVEHEQRRRVLERTFFHDVLNTAGGVQGLISMLPFVEPHEADELLALLGTATTQLIDEIKSQRLLISAEVGDLTVNCETINAGEITAEMANFYRNFDAATDGNVTIDVRVETEQTKFDSDPTLIRRILGNLIKNALEASQRDATVTVGVNNHPGAVEFWVHNDGEIPRDAQLQIFQRSFSTKGQGRGIGTYSVRMFAEKYLGGIVAFTTSRQAGTTFSVRFPLANTSAVETDVASHTQQGDITN